MKKYFRHILFLLTFLPSVINAQWYAQYISSDNFINDIRFINRYTGWACGDQIILKTTNGGTNWFNQNAHGYLNQIHPVNDSVAYVCGEYIIMKTTNGGDNWFSLKEGPTQVPIIYGLWFNNENTGWFCGDRVAMRTTDGGQTFIDSMYIDGILNDVHFKNDSVGNIAAWGSTYRTTNRGVNWYPVSLNLALEVPFTERITFVGDTGWTVSWGTIVFKTTNYGVSWDSITQIPFSSNERAYSIEFSNEFTGYAGGDGGKVFKTIDGGYNWQLNLNIGIGPFTSIYTFNDSIVWATNGDIYNTVTGGLTSITQINSNQNKDFSLYQNFPNPFNSTTLIKFRIQSYSRVILKIFNTLGQEIEILYNQVLKSGEYSKVFDGANLNSGVYFYTLELQNNINYRYYTETKKFLIIK
jgi:photosystem II stability/assembly factor-like uncharacterized protein